MRLKCIKLAGFKSFVDPTTVNFPSNMAAVVGPNGCGKSNIIDAVRWVMGESSAKNLRGESMTDVIFNGSNSRKPVGQASIELLFDNSDGSLQGEYGAYAEISIRRRVTRDGQNTYFLNGSKCRRRDITDIFLGTGLGPRSYSIIEQGMISRLIEARPEDLRHFLEEAAGISKYKERRRETESRIRRTQENLERLTDLREELGRQLERLQRQAQAAERYQAYKQEEYGLQGQLLALRWRALAQQGEAADSVLREHEIQYEAHIASQRKADADIERLREQHHEYSETFNQVQGSFYAVGAEIARIEQSIQHAQQRSRQLEEDWQRAQQEQQMAVQAQQDDAAQLQQLQGECAELVSLVEALREDKAAAAETQTVAEADWQAWQEQTNQLARDGAEPKRQADVQQARIAQLESSLERLREQAQRLQEESGRLEDPHDETELLAEQLAVIEAQIDEYALQEVQSIAALEQMQQQAKASRVQRDQLFADYQQQQGRLASLDALQEAALASDQGVQDWLTQQGAEQALALAEQIQVEPGWETAVELVLAQALSAVCLNPTMAALREFEQGDLLLLSPIAANIHADSILNYVHSAIDLSAWLGSVRAVETLEQAWALREQLALGESVISRDGYWLAPHFVRVVRQGDAQASVLARAQSLQELRASSELLAAQLEAADVQEAELQLQLAQQQEALTHLRRAREESAREAAKVSALLSAQTAKADQLRQRREGLAMDQQRLQKQRAEETELLSEARLLLEAALESMAQCEARSAQLLHAREGLRQSYEHGRTQLQQLTQQEHQAAMQLADRQARLVALEAALARLQGQYERASERLEELAAIRLEGQQPIAEWQEALQEQLAQRMDVENALQHARMSMEEADHQLRDAERQRLIAEQQASNVREQLEQLRLQRQTLSVRQQTLADELQREGWQVTDILAALPSDADIAHWEGELKQVAERIARLGAINLAAIEEYQQQGERKRYLDTQDQDLTDALSTLESVIQKIDRETRQRFKETFDKVNAGLQALFPKVFGGGTAYLELTGEDLLDTGVAIMARPPGKKNSTIHLLSGGEKALTALALVFAIFQLNPAPFCMLDEVDAPLDDANVGRYARLVKEMSASVQFIYITHNKIAMEMADQLMGVTMHEPGCSRLVAVDVEQALAMVES